MSDWNKERLFFIVIRINLIGLLARYGGAKSAMVRTGVRE